MSEPKTETYDRLRKFMSLKPDDRDEALFLQCQRFKSHLESEGLVKDVDDMKIIMNGTSEKPGLPVRVQWIEHQIQKLVNSNAQLQAAMYVCTGIWIAVKFYLEVIHKP